MQGGQNILCAETLLAKYFAEHNEEEWHPVKKVLAVVSFRGIRKSEIKAARKQLGIESKQLAGEYWWKWVKDISPEEVWMAKSKEILGERNG